MKDLRVSFPGPCSERWDDMVPQGCHRHCASCDKIIHDLASMTIAEVEALVAGEPEPCVRAVISPDGVVVTKPTVRDRRFTTALSASAALATAACQGLPAKFPVYGNVIGKVDYNGCSGGQVIAIGKDGRRYQSAVGIYKSKYRLLYLPYGDYELEYRVNGMSSSTNVGRLTVSARTVVGPTIKSEDECIVVGLMKIEPRDG